MDLQGDDFLVCPHCDHQYETHVEEVRSKEGTDIENADREQCEECNEVFLIIEFDGYYSMEVPEEEDN